MKINTKFGHAFSENASFKSFTIGIKDASGQNKVKLMLWTKVSVMGRTESGC